ncbi:MAG: hypothetical protein ABIJ09_21475 [Pseudomonadota bacterium]
MAAVAVAACALLFEACVPIPMVAPPGRLSVSASMPVAWQAPGQKQLNHPGHPDLELRAAVNPLQALRSFRDRPYELGLGYLLRYPDPFSAQLPRHGAFVEFGYYPWIRRLDSDGLRLGVLASADLLLPVADAGLAGGGGGSLSLALDWTTFLDDAEPVAEASEDGALFGWAWGEVGVGVVAGGSWQVLERGQVWSLSVGLQARIPAMAGVALIPLYEFL